MLNLILFVSKFVFIFFLYLFVLLLSRSIIKDSASTHEVEDPDIIPSAKLRSLGPKEEEHLLPDLIVIGRSDKADIRLDDDFASYNHARVVLEGLSHYLEDLDSTNGTLLNNKKIKRTKLRDGDIITIGKNSFKYIA